MELRTTAMLSAHPVLHDREMLTVNPATPKAFRENRQLAASLQSARAARRERPFEFYRSARAAGCASK